MNTTAWRRRIEEQLFPVGPGARWPRPAVAAGYVMGMGAVTGLALARQSGLAATKTVWAEDGNLFYLQAVQSSFWHTLWTPYNGYDQLVPRLLVQVAAHSPVLDASKALALCGAVSLAAVACAVFHMAKGHIGPPALRALMVGSMVLLPVATAELLDNVVNVPWWLFFAAFWATLWRPQTRPGQLLAFLITFLAVASDPLVALFLPICALRWWALREAQARGWRQHAATIGLLAGLAYQAIGRVGVTETPLAATTFHDIGRNLSIRLGLGLVTGSRGTNWVVAHSATVAIALGIAALCAVVAIGVAVKGARLFAIVASSFAIICFVVPIWLRGVSVVMADSPLSTGSRYAAVPLLILGSVLFVAAARVGPRWRPRRGGGHYIGPARGRQRLAAALLVVLLVPSWAADFRDANARSSGPDWPAQVASVGATCRSRPIATVKVSIDPPPWFTVLPCRLFRN